MLSRHPRTPKILCRHEGPVLGGNEMTEGLNKAILCGNLGADPELKFTQSGQAVLSLRIATTESFKNREGERDKRTEWHRVTVWGKRAEALDKILSKGRCIWVEGKIQTRSWEDKEGNKRYSTEINAYNIGLVSSGGGDRSRSDDDGNRSGYSYTGNPEPAEFTDDDIPF